MNQEIYTVRDPLLDEKYQAKPIQYMIDDNRCHICISHHLDNAGYPTCNRNIDGNRYWKLSRYIWYLNNGHISPEQLVLHRCDNPNCINIDHLFLGTNADNAEDKVSKGRQAIHSNLSYEDFLEIKRNISESSETLAKKYGISSATILGIWNERVGRHIAIENYDLIKDIRLSRVPNKKKVFSNEEIGLITSGEYTNIELGKMLSCNPYTIARFKGRIKNSTLGDEVHG